jgi:hypothetical protein
MFSRARARLAEPFMWKWGHVVLAAAVVSALLSGVLLAVVIIAFSLNDTQNEQIKANDAAIKANSRLDRLERPPTDRELARAASNALRGCVADNACRAALRSAIRRTNLRPSDVPRLRPRTSPGGGASTGGAGSTGSGTGSTGSGTGTDGNLTGTGTNPGSSTTSRPAPRRPAPPAASPAPPARPPATPPPPQSTPRPTPATPSTPPPAPPVPATPPPVTVTTPGVPVPPVCSPVVNVNCRTPRGRLVGPTGAQADPTSSSGRGNDEDPLCERVKAPCDDDGDPVFPVPLVRLP